MNRAMAGWAVGLCFLFAVVTLVVHPLVLRRRGGSTGWLRTLGFTRAEVAANVLYVASGALDLLGPVLVLAGVLDPVGAADIAPLHVGGFVVFALAFPLAILAQRHMGDAWRTGIDPAHPAPLVTTGLFRLVRNPIYTTMLATSVGVALLVPTAFSPVALAGCLLALEVQTRRVEEPFLERLHGERYRRYSAEVGRFVPSLGRRHAPP